ncbi:MAG: 4a-hydroxytetrahydrobiopterin dehydratase [Candidatus Nanopelagicales bacterium]
MARLLDQAEIARQLTDLGGWQLRESTFVRNYEFPDFPTAIKAVDAIAVDAEAMAHHPDIDIRWRRLHIELTTHDSGGITQLDVELAHQIKRIADELGAT